MFYIYIQYDFYKYFKLKTKQKKNSWNCQIFKTASRFSFFLQFSLSEKKIHKLYLA